MIFPPGPGGAERFMARAHLAVNNRSEAGLGSVWGPLGPSGGVHGSKMESEPLQIVPGHPQMAQVVPRRFPDPPQIDYSRLNGRVP
jgi:hypothetical protein